MNGKKYENMAQALTIIMDWMQTPGPLGPSKEGVIQLCEEAMRPTSDAYETYGKHGEIVTYKGKKKYRRKVLELLDKRSFRHFCDPWERVYRYLNPEVHK